jgi:flagellar biosynthetic protein FliQ
MGEGEIGALLRASVTVVIKLGGPPLIAALLIGIVMSLLQAVTQVQEQTVAFVPKLLAVLGTMVALGPFMLGTLGDFTRLLFDQVVAIGGQ